MKFDQDLCATCDMNSTLGSVVPLAMFSNFVKVPILSNIDCQGLAGNETIQNSMLCAGGGGQGAKKVG